MAAARGFFGAYAAFLESDASMAPCHHGIEAEIAAMPGVYVPPCGGLWLARQTNGRPLGCVALRPHAEKGAGEIKRLWVAHEGRGKGAGSALVLAVMQAARNCGYERVLLDTAPGMLAAHALYRRLGFVETAPFDGTPVPGLLYFLGEL